MHEVSVFDDTIYHFFNELFRVNHRKWKKQILQLMAEHKRMSYHQIKVKLEEVPELLVYRCIQELVTGEVLIRKQEERAIYYTLSVKNLYIREILKACQIEADKW